MMLPVQGSFDCAGRFASESACSAQDDRVKEMTGLKVRAEEEVCGGALSTVRYCKHCSLLNHQAGVADYGAAVAGNVGGGGVLDHFSGLGAQQASGG